MNAAIRAVVRQLFGTCRFTAFEKFKGLIKGEIDQMDVKIRRRFWYRGGNPPTARSEL